MLLTRDVLDRQLIDRRGHRMGRVDGIVLELRPGELPKVAFMESGGGAPWRRLGRRMAGWVEAIQRRLPGSDEPARVPWATVLRMDAAIEVSLDATETPEMALELWLRKHVVRHMPWA
jgi:sporulation protein YlmC with PRC-barrel domain